MTSIGPDPCQLARPGPLHRSAFGPNQFIIVFSGRKEAPLRQEMLLAGADDYVVKTGRLRPLAEALGRAYLHTIQGTAGRGTVEWAEHWTAAGPRPIRAHAARRNVYAGVYREATPRPDRRRRPQRVHGTTGPWQPGRFHRIGSPIDAAAADVGRLGRGGSRPWSSSTAGITTARHRRHQCPGPPRRDGRTG